MVFCGETEKSSHQNCSVEKSPQEKNPQISPVEKIPQLILQLVEKSPRPFWGHVEKNPQFSKKPSNIVIQFFYLIHISDSNNGDITYYTNCSTCNIYYMTF